MKRRIFTLFAAAGCTFGAYAQAPDQAEAMKAWEAYMTPGEVHKMIAKADGKWTTENSMWMDPGAPPMKTTGTATNRMILGGRYQETSFKGTMMGKPFEGFGLLGYDNKTSVFTSVWVDNVGTGTTTLRGKWDEATRSITFTGTMVDPMNGQDMPVREVFTMKDNDHQLMEMYQTVGGQEMKMMEIKYTRAKK